MTKQITVHVLQCSVCLTNCDYNAKEPFIFPDRPYQKIGVDLFHFDGKEYLLTVDYYSRFFEVDYLPDTRSSAVILKLQVHLSRNGICDILVSDNGPQFSSAEFDQFAKSWGFDHITSSPFHPQGNALAEKGVGIAKKLMKKAKDTGQSPYLAFLEYRNTPLECGYTPAQLLFSRRTKSVVPISNKALQPKLVNQKVVKEKMQTSKNKQKSNYDTKCRSLKPLSENDAVRVQFGRSWKPAKVLAHHDNRSYTVQTRDGGIYRRNRRLLHQVKENVSDIDPFSANILADQFQTNNDPPLNINSPETNIKSNGPGPYITRSGRAVKENQRYASDQWVK